MKLNSFRIWTFLVLFGLSLPLVGCGQQDGDKDKQGEDGKSSQQDDEGHDHDGHEAHDADGEDGKSPKDGKESDADGKQDDDDKETDDGKKAKVDGKDADDGKKDADDGKKAKDEGDKAAKDDTEPAPKDDEKEDGKAKGDEEDGKSAKATAESAPKVAGDWPLWGGDVTRNMVNTTTGVTIDFAPPNPDYGQEASRLLWKMQAGSQAYANPVVADGRVYVGCNNGSDPPYRPKQQGDKGVVLCFDELTGELQWQLTRDKLPQGRVNDWPEQGICSTPCVDGKHVFVVTNRAEVMCVDAEGFHDGENDGPFTDEIHAEPLDADIVWSLDMIEELGVFPHNLATSSPLVWKDWVYLVTSNGVGEEHLEIPAPRAPSFICLNKKTGELVWEENTPFDNILHGQWSSPCVAEVDGQTQIVFPGGDGWIYAFTPEGTEDGFGELIWKFDMNPKASKWELGGRGTRNAIIGTPVFHEGSIIVAVGQDPEHGEGVGHIYRIDAGKKGDVSPTLVVNEAGEPVRHRRELAIDVTKGEKIVPNENSAEIWHWGGVDEDGSITGKENGLIFRRTMSTVAVHGGLVYAPDLSGRVHCLDFETGKRYWEHDKFSAIWGSPMYVDGKVLVGDEEGDLTVYEAGKELNVLTEIVFPNSVYSTPTIANGRAFVTDRTTLYAFDVVGDVEPPKAPKTSE